MCLWYNHRNQQKKQSQKRNQIEIITTNTFVTSIQYHNSQQYLQSNQFNYLLQDQLQFSLWKLTSFNFKNFQTQKILRFQSFFTSHNKLELQIKLQQDYDHWSAEGHVYTNSEQEIYIHLRTSLDCDLLDKNDRSDHLYLLQQFKGKYNKEENKFVGSWSVYGSQELNNLNFFGEFELSKILI